MSYRPLVLVSGLTLGDYLLWNWSLNGNHEVLALIAGLTLPPLALAWVWLIAVNLARLLSRGTRRISAQRVASEARAASHAGRLDEEMPAAAAHEAANTAGDRRSGASRKIAA